MSDVDLSNDLTGTSGETKYFFDAGRGLFWKEFQQGENPVEWIELREAAMRRDLMKSGLSHKIDPAKGKISPLDDRIRTIEQGQRVRRAMEVAGYKVGVHRMGSDLVLVPRSAQLIKPAKGSTLLVAAFLEGLFVGQERTDMGPSQPARVETHDQRDRWLAWMQGWLQSLYAGSPTSGLCFHLAGEPECGKTRLAEMMKELTGGRVGKPYRYMIGKDDFNRELFEASLQLVDDENADTNIEARKELAAQIKIFVANADLKLRGMHQDGFNVKPNWRLVVLTNLEAEALLVMPPLTGDIADKIFMAKGYRRPRPPAAAYGTPEMDAYLADKPALAAWLKHAIETGVVKAEAAGRCWPMPMPTDHFREQLEFWDRMRAEFPAFVFWLLEEYGAPSQVLGGRFGVREWQHPEILEALSEFSPHVRFWRIIERSGVVFRRKVPHTDPAAGDFYEDTKEWTGSADDLEKLLRDEGNNLNRHERDREVRAASWIGQRLKEAQRHWPGLVDFKRTGMARKWTLKRDLELTG